MIVVLSTLTALIVMKAHEPEKIYGCFSIVICLAGATKVEGGVEVPVDLRVWETMLRRVLLGCTRHERRLSVGCHCASISRRYRESHRSRDPIEAKYCYLHFSLFKHRKLDGWSTNTMNGGNWLPTNIQDTAVVVVVAIKVVVTVIKKQGHHFNFSRGNPKNSELLSRRRPQSVIGAKNLINV